MVDPGETNPCNADSDGDGIQDGTESGYTAAMAGPDTDLSVFKQGWVQVQDEASQLVSMLVAPPLLISVQM